MEGGHTEVADTAAILNACWHVRALARGGRSSIQKERRAQAIQFLGLVLRDALNRTENFEPLLTAIADGLRPRDEQPF